MDRSGWGRHANKISASSERVKRKILKILKKVKKFLGSKKIKLNFLGNNKNF